MTHTTITRHKLEMRRAESGLWDPCVAGMYREAISLCEQGRLIEALEKAADSHIANYGSSQGIVFRCQSVSVTTTTLDRDGHVNFPASPPAEKEG